MSEQDLTSKSNGKKLLILGLDGGTFDLVRPWAEQGHLPTLKRLLDEGVSCDLNSTFPPVTSPAWPSFMTGMNPGKHGVFDFIRPKGTDYDMVNATSIQQPTVWARFARAGTKVGMVNIPVTYPPQKLENSFIISGLLSPHSGTISHPANLIKKYEGRLGPYRIAPAVQYSRGREDEYIDDIYDLVRVRGKWSLELLENEPWDVFMVVFGETDIGSHALWRFADETHPQHDPDAPDHIKNGLRNLYALVDEQMGKLIEAAGEDTTVLVMSDHGFGPLHYTVNLNLLLMQSGLMQLKRKPLTQIKAWLFKNGISPQTIYQFAEKLGVHNIAARVSKKQRNAVFRRFLSYEDVDWSRTVAFSMGHVGQIYINTRGRWPHGCVEPGYEEYEVREKVIEALNGMRHPETGEPIVERIILGSEEYSGPYADRGPDIQLIMDGYRCISFPLFATTPKLYTEQIRGDSGNHRREGMFIASGPGIKRGEIRETANILDVAPTMMYLMGQPVPVEMDGQVLTDILEKPGEVTYAETAGADIDPETGLSTEEAEEVKDRLRGLGYLED